MASSSLLLLSLSAILLFTIGADARPGVHFHPCKTFVITSSYTFSSFKPINPNNQLRSREMYPFIFRSSIMGRPQLQQQQQQQPQEVQFLDLTKRPYYDSSSSFQFRFPHSIPYNPIHHVQEEENKPLVPFLPFHVTNSLRERTKDILSVVVALLFGVGCGALTSATMYLIWSLVTNRYEAVRDMDDSEDDGFYDDDLSPKKNGYIFIATPTTTDGKEAAPTPVKEVV